MKPASLSLRGVLLWLWLLAAGGLAGCATHDPDNLSARPCNAPKGWESGFPSGMLEGR